MTGPFDYFESTVGKVFVYDFRVSSGRHRIEPPAYEVNRAVEHRHFAEVIELSEVLQNLIEAVMVSFNQDSLSPGHASMKRRASYFLVGQRKKDLEDC